MAEANEHSKSQQLNQSHGAVTGGITESQPRQQPNPTTKSHSHPTTTGWASMGSTSAFRAINFELFVKPNKYVMACGVLAFTGCLSYIVYMNVTDDKRKDSYVTMDEDGELRVRQKTSRWY